VAIVRNGVETVIPRSSWNVDKMDGNGPSGRILYLSRGNIYKIQIVWYGYGSILFEIVTTDSLGVQIVQNVHRWAPAQQTSVMTPHVPICVSLQNGRTASPATIYIAGRQYSLLGDYSPIYRVTAVYDTSSLNLSTTAFTPVMSIKRKAGAAGVGLKIASYDISSDSTVFVQLRVNSTLTAANFVNIQDSPSTESMVTYDVSATTVSGGVVIYTELISGNGMKAESTASSEAIAYNAPEYQTVTMCVRATTTGGNATVSAVLRLKEEY
jgi:hypothetical protein